MIWQSQTTAAAAMRRRPGDEMGVGRADVAAAAAAEVLTAEQAAELLQTDAEAVRALAETGELPGRRSARSGASCAGRAEWLGGSDATAPRLGSCARGRRAGG